MSLKNHKQPLGWLRTSITACIVPLCLLIAWDLVVRFNLVPSTLVASPLATFNDFCALIMDGTLAKHTLISLIRLSLGFAVGSTIGIVCGACLATSRTTSRLFDPTLSVLGPIPAIAWIPLLIMLFGIGESSKVILIAFGTFFVIVTHVVTGIRGTSRELVELAQVLGKNQWDLFCFVLFPSALPEIFVGLRVAMGLSWTLLLVTEIIASSQGLGWLIWDARNFSRPDDLFVGMIVVGLLGRLSDRLLVTLEGSLTRWRSTYASWQNHV
jgi:ABC-type nitrate/sulfonate/bicarbonate transport system permease component